MVRRCNAGRRRCCGAVEKERSSRRARDGALSPQRYTHGACYAHKINGTSIADVKTDAPFGGAQMRRFRTLFLSDIHLGMKGCQAERLLDFLRWHEADTIYLVGDIVDGWQMRSSWYWPQLHNDVVQKLLRQARKGTRIIYMPGNHDEFLRDYYGTHFGGIDVVENAVHEGADGRRYLVIHGDMFDFVVTPGALARPSRREGLRPRSDHQHGLQPDPAAARLSLLVAVAMGQAQGQERRQLHRRLREDDRREARRYGVDGVICGHIHHAAIHDDFGVRYINCGDWVENCTALVEHNDGRFEIIVWTDTRELRKSAPRLAAPQAA